MTVRNAAGTVQTKTTVMGLMSDITPDQNKVYRFDGGNQLFEGYTPDGVSSVDSGRRLAFVPGRVYTKSQIDRMFPVASISGISPATGPAAGGTTVTIKGQNLTGTSAVTFGGTAGTSVTVIDANTVTVVTPAKTAGAYNVVLTDDSGTVTVTNGFTYS